MAIHLKQKVHLLRNPLPIWKNPKIGENIEDLYISKLNAVLPIFHGESEDELKKGLVVSPVVYCLGKMQLCISGAPRYGFTEIS
jgi:sortase (surface protein transpeptidase)